MGLLFDFLVMKIWVIVKLDIMHLVVDKYIHKELKE